MFTDHLFRSLKEKAGQWWTHLISLGDHWNLRLKLTKLLFTLNKLFDYRFWGRLRAFGLASGGGCLHELKRLRSSLRWETCLEGRRSLMLNGTNNKKSSLLNRFTAVFVPTVFTITKSKASNFTWLHVSQLKTICAAVKADSHTNNKYINVKGRSTHKGHTRYFFIIWSLRPRTAAFYDLLPSSLHNPIEVREVSCEVLLHTQEKIQ